MIRVDLSGLRPVLDLWRLAYYRAARDNLQRTDPCHPDLPEIVMEINRLERSAR
jgi:hypothetical protein